MPPANVICDLWIKFAAYFSVRDEILPQARQTYILEDIQDWLVSKFETHSTEESGERVSKIRDEISKLWSFKEWLISYVNLFTAKIYK